MNQTYYFINQHPGSYKLRDGKVIPGVRTAEEWQRALAGHVERSHCGVEQVNCAGCRELRKKARI